MELFLPMAKLVLERHLLFKDRLLRQQMETSNLFQLTIQLDYN